MLIVFGELRRRYSLLFGRCETGKAGGKALSDQRKRILEKRFPGSTCTLKTKSGKQVSYVREESRKAVADAQRKKRAGRRAIKTLRSEGASDLRRGAALGRLRALGAMLREANPPSVYETDPGSIAADPGRFQYKILGAETATGEVGSLSGASKYDPDLAGIIQVWKDPDDGKTYVVNGHNRLALARRSGAKKVAVRRLNVSSAKEARAIGALTNIAEGNGTPVDAAKFFRDTGIGASALKEKGVSLKADTARMGMAIARLPNLVFREVLDGDLPVEIGAAIGETGFGDDLMHRLRELAHRAESRGRRITPGAVEEMADMMRSSEARIVAGEDDLFGGTETLDDAFTERAMLQEGIRKEFRRQARVFGTAARGAKDLAAVGSIDREGAAKLGKSARVGEDLFGEFQNDSRISKILNEAARRMANASPAKRRELISSAFETVRRELPGVAGLKE